MSDRRPSDLTETTAQSARGTPPSKEGTSQKPDPRHGWRAFWLLVLIGLAVAGTWLGLRLRCIQSAYPGLSPNVPLAAEKSYGVNADLTQVSSEELDRTLAQMSGLGLRWIRQPFTWAEIEPTPGQFNWGPWDRVAERATAHRLELIAVLDTTPAWARPPDTTPFTPPTELADFGYFARALAERYGDRVDYYQIWDEPNLSAHWGDQFVEPSAYARLLREGAINLRAADTDTLVLTAALAPTVETGPLNLNESAFLAGLYAANATPWFDVVSAQPYGFESEPTAPPDEASLNFSRAELLRHVMVAHDDGEKPIWATAFGWSALPQPWTGEFSPWPSLSPDRQGTYTTQAIRHARANWPWLGPMFFAAWDAGALPDDDPRRGLALVNGEVPLPQVQVLHADEANNDPLALPDEEVASVGTYPADHPSGHYIGDWRLAPVGADVPRHPPATLTIPFQGTRLDLLVRRGAFRGFLYVTIDGEPANALPRRDGRAYVVLYDPLEQEDTVTLARYLPDGPHTVQIEADGGWYQWPVIGWQVSREADTRAIRLGLILVGGLGVVAAVGLAVSMRYTPPPRVYSWVDTAHKRYMSFGTPWHLAILGITVLAFYFAPGTLLSLGLLGLLLLALLFRPDLALTLIAFSLPFFLLPKALVGRTISMTEVLLVLVALALVTRRTMILIRASENQYAANGARWLDWLAWILTVIAILAGLLTVVPGANTGPLATADWPVLALMLLPLAGVLAAVAQDREEDAKYTLWPTPGLDLAVVALVGLSLVATLAAKSFGVSLQEFHVVVWDGAAFYAFVRLIPSPDAKNRASRSNAERLAWSVVDAFLLGTTLMALYAIYQFFFTDQAITAEGVHRALGVYGSPNNLALLLDRAAPILITVAIVPLLIPVGGRTPPNGQMRLRRILYGLALIPILGGLVLTFSRGALLLGLPAAILFIGIVRGGRALWAAAGALVIGGVALLPLFGTDRFRSMLDTSAGTGFFRLRLWQGAWNMLRDHPWLGVGLDNFLYQYRTRYILPDAWQEPNLSHPHNIVFDFGTRLGVGGIVVLLWLQIAFWRIAWRLYRRLPEGGARALTLGLMSSMVATLTHGLVDNAFFLVDLAFIFFMTLGIVGKLATSDE
jgi:O-antigen ligase